MASSLLPAALVLAAPQAHAPVDAMRWEQRVLLVFAPEQRDLSLAEQRRIIGAQASALNARRLRIVEVVGETLSGARDYAPRLRERYHIGSGDFAAVLIGADGAIKLRSNRPLDAAQLFAPFAAA